MLHTDVIAPIPRLLAKHATEQPDQVAFRDPDRAVTYAELDTRTAHLAGHLLDLGMIPGDRLLMYLDNCVEVAEGYLVAPRADIVTVCANPGGTRHEFEHILTDSDATAVLTDDAHLPTILELIENDEADTSRVQVVIVTGARNHDRRHSRLLRRTTGRGSSAHRTRFHRPRLLVLDALHLRDHGPTERGSPHPAQLPVGGRCVLGAHRRTEQFRRSALRPLPLLRPGAVRYDQPFSTTTLASASPPLGVTQASACHEEQYVRQPQRWSAPASSRHAVSQPA